MGATRWCALGRRCNSRALLAARSGCVEEDISKNRNGIENHTNPSISEAFLLPRVLTNRRKQGGIVFLRGRNEKCLVGYHSGSSSRTVVMVARTLIQLNIGHISLWCFLC